MVYKFFDKTFFCGAVTCAWSETLATQDKSVIKSEYMPNQQLTEELHKPIIRKFEKQKVYASLKIFGVLI